MFYKGESNGNEDINLFKKSNVKNVNGLNVPVVNKNNSASPLKRTEQQPISTHRVSCVNSLQDICQTARIEANDNKFQNAQRLLDSQREKLIQTTKPNTKVDLNINQLFNKTQSSGFVKNNNLTTLSKQFSPSTATTLNNFNVSNTINIKMNIDETREKVMNNKIIIPGERVLMKVNTARESSNKEKEEEKKNSRTSSRIFDEILEDPNQKKINQQMEFVNKLLSNSLISDDEFKAFIFK